MCLEKVDFPDPGNPISTTKQIRGVELSTEFAILELGLLLVFTVYCKSLGNCGSNWVQWDKPGNWLCVAF